MKYRVSLCVSALCFFTAFLIAMSARQQGGEALAARIAPEILRFHILANSDSDEDQQLKLEVKGLVIDYVSRNLGDSATKAQTAGWLLDNREAIEDMAHSYLVSRGKDYPVTLELAQDYFPTKAYGDMVFPCGTYDAARITIGSGRGHNWWCVLYPPLCYTDAMNAVVPETSRETLKALIPDEDYEALLPESQRTGHETGKPRVQVRFRLAELLGLGKDRADSGK